MSDTQEVAFTGGIDIESLKKQLAEDKAKKERSNFKDIFWKPSAPETMIRIIPYQHGKSPFNELHFHYDINGKTILCPKHTFGKADCPICSEVERLYSTGLEEDKEKAKKIRAKARYYIPIIVRTEIDRGQQPKAYFWGVAPTVYDSIIKFCLIEDYGNIADPLEGNDLIVENTPRSQTNPFGKVVITARAKKTPLLSDPEEAKRIFKSVPNIYDLFKELTPAEIQAEFDKMTAKENEDAGEEANEGKSLADKIADIQKGE